MTYFSTDFYSRIGNTLNTTLVIVRQCHVKCHQIRLNQALNNKVKKIYTGSFIVFKMQSSRKLGYRMYLRKRSRGFTETIPRTTQRRYNQQKQRIQEVYKGLTNTIETGIYTHLC